MNLPVPDHDGWSDADDHDFIADSDDGDTDDEPEQDE